VFGDIVKARRGKMIVSKAAYFAIAIILLLVALSSENLSQRSVDIDGYLVDVNDKPLPNGRVTVLYDPPLPTTSFERLIITWTPMVDGLFGVAAQWYPGHRIMVLLEDRPDGFYPIHDSKVLTNKRIFKGVVIAKYASKRDLGRVTDYIQYGQASVDLTKCPALFLEKILKYEMYLKVSTPDGFVAAAKTTFRSAYIKDKEQLVFNLPEGVWQMEFIDGSTKEVVSAAANVTVKPTETVYVVDLAGC
jgi:hypothetical protein